jgi:hypothetical protein
VKLRLPLLGVALLTRLLSAQGVTTGAFQGTVAAEDGSPIARATVRITLLPDGRRWEVMTQSNGGYLVEDVAVGGPYRIEAQAFGFAPQARTGIVLALGQRLVADFALRPAAVELAPIAVPATADPVLNPGRTGAAEIVSAARIAALPNLGRDFVMLVTLSPQVAVSPSSRRGPTGGLTVSGGDRLLNGFLIDGGINHDPYTGRLPGRETLPRPISLDALQEIQVLVAPFDVRHGGFAGGLASAVTKSGTNAVHGSVFSYLADGALVGDNATGVPVSGFTTWQYGGTIGGPIVRDRAHYFLSVDVQHRVVPDPGPLITDTAGGADTVNIGIRYANATRFEDILRNTYGLDPGTLGPSNGGVPATDVFGKITVQLGTNSHLEVSHHYADGDRQGFLDRAYGSYRLTSQRERDPATANASRLIWTSLLGGRWSSELIASHLSLRDGCRPAAVYPVIRVQADRGLLLAGTPVVCPSSFRQNAFEVTENLTTAFGAHVFTLGAQAGLLRSDDNQLTSGAGQWNFRNLDSLAARRAFHYERALVGASGTSGITFRTGQIGLYTQDRWSPTNALTLTAGVRIDVTLLPDAVAANDSLRAAVGMETGRLPSGAPLWSPRLGFNYDLGGKERTFIRGGIGLFSGPPPYAWVGSAYRDDGVHTSYLSCDGGAVPPFDPLNQATTCTTGPGASPQVTVFDPRLSFPQSLKIALGADHELPGGIVGTVDVLYARAVHQWYFSDANLGMPVGAAAGEGGRPLYGTINAATGFATPVRRTPAFGPVVRVSDRSGDRSFTLAVQLRKQFGDRVEGNVFYGYTQARDRMSLVNAEEASANLQNTPLNGTLEARPLATSYFEVPHRVELSAVARLPYNVRLSLLYAGASGTPFTYTITGDANADGIGSGPLVNDIVYVPRDSLDITLKNRGDWGALGRFIESEPCLRAQRGRILARNSCRNPWFGTLNARVTKAFPTLYGQSLELTADVYNMLNLLHRQWGQSRATALNPPAQPLLQLVGYDTGAGRGIYRLQLPALDQIQDLASRWQMELGVRYVF